MQDNDVFLPTLNKNLLTARRFCRIFLLFISYAPVAQLVEQLPFKEMVEGSSPSGRT